jgi:hypothetical protein
MAPTLSAQNKLLSLTPMTNPEPGLLGAKNAVLLVNFRESE